MRARDVVKTSLWATYYRWYASYDDDDDDDDDDVVVL